MCTYLGVVQCHACLNLCILCCITFRPMLKVKEILIIQIAFWWLHCYLVQTQFRRGLSHSFAPVLVLQFGRVIYGTKNLASLTKSRQTYVVRLRSTLRKQGFFFTILPKTQAAKNSRNRNNSRFFPQNSRIFPQNSSFRQILVRHLWPEFFGLFWRLKGG